MNYEDMKENQKLLFNTIEAIFINNELISKEDMVVVLAMLINKYKR